MLQSAKFINRLSSLLVILILSTGLWSFSRRLPLEQDEAYNLNLIQTLIDKGIYASSLGGELIPFDPDVSVGPAFVLPFSIAFSALPTSLAAVRGITVLAACLCLAAILLLLCKLVRLEVALGLICLLVATPLVAEAMVWAHGQFLSITFALGGILLLHERSSIETWRRAISFSLGTLLVSLAVLTKAFVLPTAGILVLVGSLRLILKRDADLGWRLLAAGLVSMGAFACWGLFQAASVKANASFDYVNWAAHSLTRNQVLLSTLVFAPLSNLAQATGIIKHSYLPVFLAAIICVFWCERRGRILVPFRQWTALESTLFWLAFAWTAWFILLAGRQAGQSHLLQAVIFAEVFIAVRINSLANGSGRISSILRSSLLAVLGVIFLWTSLLGKVGTAPVYARRLQDQLAFASHVRQAVPEADMLSGWGWFVPWNISFLSQRQVSTANLHTVEMAGLTRWFVAVPEIRETVNWDERLEGMLKSQGELICSQGGYELHRLDAFPEIIIHSP